MSIPPPPDPFGQGGSNSTTSSPSGDSVSPFGTPTASTPSPFGTNGTSAPGPEQAAEGTSAPSHPMGTPSPFGNPDTQAPSPFGTPATGTPSPFGTSDTSQQGYLAYSPTAAAPSAPGAEGTGTVTESKPSKTTALLLALFLGGVGGPDFYLGYHLLGGLKILTFLIPVIGSAVFGGNASISAQSTMFFLNLFWFINIIWALTTLIMVATGTGMYGKTAKGEKLT